MRPSGLLRRLQSSLTTGANRGTMPSHAGGHLTSGNMSPSASPAEDPVWLRPNSWEEVE